MTIFDLYLLASGKNDKTDNETVAILLKFLGDEGIQIYNTFEYQDAVDEQNPLMALEKFNNYCNRVNNLMYEHFKFFE